MPEVITIGETMVVFDSVSAGPLRYSNQFTCRTGGAETNVAVGVVRLGHSAGWISRVGKDEFGRKIIQTFRGEGVDVSHVEMDPSRPTGIFFRENAGNGEFRNTYYRNTSAFSVISPEFLDEDYIRSAKYLMVSGITLAVNPEAAATAKRAMEIAREAGVNICFDPNLRLKMWSAEQARETMESLWPMVDIALPGVDEGKILFGLDQPDEIAAHLQRAYDISTVVVKVGADGAIGYQNGEKVVSPGFHSSHVVDAFGAGDSFCAGVLCGFLNEWPLARTLRFANAVGCMVVSAPGNIEAIPYEEQVIAFLEGREGITR